MENEYKLILNVNKEMKTIYEKSLQSDGYEIIENQENLLFARKTNNTEKIDIEKEKKAINFILMVMKKYQNYGILYMDLTKEMSLIMKEETDDIAKNGQIRWAIRQAITKAIVRKRKWNKIKEAKMFKLHSEYKPTGDQPNAIEYLSNGVKQGKKYQTLLGVTGSRKNIYNGKYNPECSKANTCFSTQ